MGAAAMVAGLVVGLTVSSPDGPDRTTNRADSIAPQAAQSAAPPAAPSDAPTVAVPSPTPVADGSATAQPSPAPSVSPGPVAPAATRSAAPAAGRTTAAPPAKPSTAPPTSGRTTAAPPVGGTQEQFARQVLDLTNVQRAQNGCGPLTGDAKLQAAAQGHSEDMAARDFFDHTNPDGDSPGKRIEAAGYLWRGLGENIARGQADPATVVDGWMHSPGHRANILNCSLTELGVGVHLGPGGPWWTQDFGTPR
ncbi:CAP domain-containing protein [Kitasatospora sp. NBC_00374]|uniref:CAP domain-containing protein n=1 Tax=Kitasatospora sp. NBC_00374 TaxID=2975964 RepID=UPI0030E2DCF9